MTPTATNTPATLPGEFQNDDDSHAMPVVWDDGSELIDSPVDVRGFPDAEDAPFLWDSVGGIVIVGSVGTKLVMTTVVPRSTVTVAIDLEELVEWELPPLLLSEVVDVAVVANNMPDPSPI
jgi:hypothetical protein